MPVGHSGNHRAPAKEQDMARTKPPSRSSHDDQRAALCAGVKESPEDDSPRLVLADWLEENGDEDDRAHAELIRVQCEILRLSAQIIDPERPEAIHNLLGSAEYRYRNCPFNFAAFTEEDSRIVSLRKRELALVQTFGGRQLTALRSRPACRWHRGFARLHLGRFLSREMTALADGPTGPFVEDLGLDVVPSNSARIARNLVLSHAAGLQVYGFQLDKASLTTLLSSPHLVGLRRLDLTMRLTDHVNVAVVARAPQRSRLTHLALECNYLDAPRLRTLAAVDLPSLRALDLAENHKMGEQGVRALACAPFLGHLRELILKGCRLQPTWLEPLVSSEHFRCPALLEIAGNNLTQDSLRTLLAAPGLDRLVALDVSRNSLDDLALADLAGEAGLQGLLGLSACHNLSIGPAGAEALASSPHLSRLAFLDLQGCPIGEAGARALLNAPHLRRLALRIDQTGVSRPILRGLSQRYHLVSS
jgi:uncharacterized protein (TIGR02996 family)